MRSRRRAGSVSKTECRMLENHMKESQIESKVYEVSYLLVPSVPQEKVVDEAAQLEAILAKGQATILSKEAPSLISLAYEMSKSTGSGTHDRYTEGYFGWIKFECPATAVEAI